MKKVIWKNKTEVKSVEGLELYHPDNLFKISNPNISNDKISEMVIALTISKEKAWEQLEIMEEQLRKHQEEI